MNNIFQIGGQVTGSSFIGRKAFVKLIRDNFLGNNNKMSKAIVGLTRIGKSSAITNSFLEIPENVIYIYENLNEYSQYTELWQDICYEVKDYLIRNERLSEEIGKQIDSIENNLPWVRFKQAIKKIFKYLADEGIRTIIILDEFDNAITLFSGGTRHFELFRSIFAEAQYNVSTINISRRNLSTIESKAYQNVNIKNSGSTYHGIFDSIPFKGFDEIDMKEYYGVFESQGILLDEKQKEKIEYYAGNTPFLLSIIGYYIIDAAENSQEIDIDRIFLDRCKAINDYYRDCFAHLEREGDIKRIIPFILGPNVGVTQNDKNELFNLGYFSEENGKLVVISEYFMEFLRANQLSVSIWDNIITVEKKLKQLIEIEMPQIKRCYMVRGGSINDCQRAILVKVPGVNSDDIFRYDNYISKNKREFNIDSTYLDVMSMADAIKIIKDCWNDIFSKYFNYDLYSKWKKIFDKCAKARNPIAHGHEEYLTELEKHEVDVFCNQILKVLSGDLVTTSDNGNDTNTKKTDDQENPKITYEEPVDDLIGKTVEMLAIETNKTGDNLRGIIEKKYKAVITKNYLIGKDINGMINQTIQVVIEKIANGQYQVKPVD